MAAGSDNFVMIASSILNFSVMAGVMAYFGKKPFKNILDGRSKDISESMKTAEQEYSTASNLFNTWKKSFDGSEAEASLLQDQANAAIEKFKKNSIENASSLSTRIQEDSVRIIESEWNRANKFLQKEVVNKSTALVEKNLGKTLNPKEKSVLISKALEGVS